MRDRLLSKSEVERATEMLDWCYQVRQISYEALRSRKPDAGENELLALWTEQTYRQSMPPEWVAKAVAMIRERALRDFAPE